MYDIAHNITHKGWSTEEIDRLVELAPTHNREELMCIFNKTINQIQRILHKVFEYYDNNVPDGFVRIKDTDIHAINKYGKVIRVKTRKEIKLHPNPKGYLVFCGTNRKSFRVHREVAKIFVPITDTSRDQVNHIDGNKLNNSYTNLEWVTNAENAHHKKINNLGKTCKAKESATGINNSQVKLCEDDVRYIRYLYDEEGYKVSDIHLEFQNVTYGNILAITSRRSWKNLI